VFIDSFGSPILIAFASTRPACARSPIYIHMNRRVYVSSRKAGDGFLNSEFIPET